MDKILQQCANMAQNFAYKTQGICSWAEKLSLRIFAPTKNAEKCTKNKPELTFQISKPVIKKSLHYGTSMEKENP